MDYLRADKGNLSGIALLEHFTWLGQESRTEDFLVAGIEDWAETHNIFLNDLAEMRDIFLYAVAED